MATSILFLWIDVFNCSCVEWKTVVLRLLSLRSLSLFWSLFISVKLLGIFGCCTALKEYLKARICFIGYFFGSFLNMFSGNNASEEPRGNRLVHERVNNVCLRETLQQRAADKMKQAQHWTTSCLLLKNQTHEVAQYQSSSLREYWSGLLKRNFDSEICCAFNLFTIISYKFLRLLTLCWGLKSLSSILSCFMAADS